jgi:TolB-like protein
MPSLIQNYNYDIFISYRQNDNKYDGWVTEFVANLNKELEATIKDKVNVYFDANPHDGLLETHSVDRSLSNKLRCLIFIPILSRTYCDPKSYAWNHEFLAFLNITSEDSIGLNIQLSSGNVASRVLPVRIHDLNPEDVSLVESKIGVIRSIDFIYKSPGVNRPLRANEDHPQDNLNKTYYRDQINKVANAIDEIISGLKKMHDTQSKSESANDLVVAKHSEEEMSKGLSSSHSLNQTSKRWLVIALSLVMCIIAALAICKVIDNRKQSQDVSELERSIAVLPFINDSPDQENAYFINGIMEEILNNLQKIKDFRVLSRSSTEQYRGIARPTIPEIAKKLDVNYIVEGSGQKYGSTFRLRVQLIAANNEKHLWAESYEQEIKETKDIFKIQSRIAQSIAAELKVTITPEEKQLIGKIPTINLTAYDFCQRAKEESIGQWPKFNPEAARRAEILFHKALKCDSTYAEAYAGLGYALWIKLDRDQTLTETNIRNKLIDSLLVLSDIALSYDDKLAEAYVIKSAYFGFKGSPVQHKEELDKANRLNPNDASIYYFKAMLIEDQDLIEALENLLKAASLTHGPELPLFLKSIGYCYHMAGFPDKGNDLYLEALKLDDDSAFYSKRLVYFKAETQGDYQKAIEYYEKKSLTDSTDYEILGDLGYYYSLLGRSKESLKYYEKYILVLKASGKSDIPMYQTLGYAYLQNGFRKEAKYYFDKQIEVFSHRLKKAIGSEKITWAYKLAGVYAGIGDKRHTYENLKIFNENPISTSYWVTLINHDPLFNSIRNEPEFQKIVKNVESKYQAEHERVRKWLEEQNKL